MATTFVCPKGDQSDDPEFCSVCGIKIEGAPSALSTDTAVERCPTCGIERKPGTRFCETCRYDFKAQVSPPPLPLGEVARSADQGAQSAHAPVAPSTPPARVESASWEAIVTVDPSLDVEPDPTTPCPADAPERTFPLDLAENLIGRRSAARGSLPQISVDDPGVSHRHLVVYRNLDASLMVSDLGSTNGTFLNGSSDRLEAGVKTPVVDGDRIELGRWTRITFRHRT